MFNFPYIHETEDLTDIIRARAGGCFIRLTDGVCHYELFPDPDTLGQRLIKGEFKTVVLIHGFSVPFHIWNPTYQFLARNGFRVLRYDLFGRGYSDRPRTTYNIHLFVRQLKDLLDNLELKNPVDLAGVSMGGPISAAFTVRYPDRVKSNILIDPSGAKAIQSSRKLKVAKIPFLPELLLGLFGAEYLVKNTASDFFSPDLIEHFLIKYKTQMRYKGFLRAILSTIRAGMLDSFLETYQRAGRLKKPTLLIWGRDDTTVPFLESRDLLTALPHANFHPITNSGHIPHYERPEIVNPILLNFLSSGY